MLKSFTSHKCKNNDKVIIQLISISPYVSKIYSSPKTITLKSLNTEFCAIHLLVTTVKGFQVPSNSCALDKELNRLKLLIDLNITVFALIPSKFRKTINNSKELHKKINIFSICKEILLFNKNSYCTLQLIIKQKVWIKFFIHLFWQRLKHLTQSY